MLWNTSYETGNTQVDEEHKEIFRLVETLIKAAGGEDSVESTIDFLAGYTVNHFKHEEKLMKESAYSMMPIHKKQHEDFVAQVLALRERVLNETDPEKNNADIQKIIINWLTDHVLGSDKLMANHYRAWAEGRDTRGA
ncbi:MAG: hemerythrin family protein [Defluviitaleaceae bacterium]|nr:hemerythrin family protein [Defluviitaleaceae bacterium]MCL2275541.1 hemerythrin family protein [Defluviitaleaceae bacterium]